MERRRYLRSVALAGGAVSFAGCMDDSGNGMDDGNGDDNGGGNGDDDTPTDTEGNGNGDDATQTPTETDEPGGQTESPPSDPDQRVTVSPGGSLSFDPAGFEISVGDTVLWEWDGNGHNISYDDGQVPDGTDWEGDDEELYSGGHTHFFTFETVGEYNYYCQPHRSSGMTGSFTVTE